MSVRPPSLKDLPKITAGQQFGCSGVKQLFAAISDEEVMSRMVTSATLNMAKGTPVEEVLRKLLSEFRANFDKLTPSWRWKAIRMLPVDTKNSKNFMTNCVVHPRDMCRLMRFVFETLIPADLLGAENGEVLVEWLSDFVFEVKPPNEYPQLKALNSAPLRATRSKAFRTAIGSQDICNIMKASLLHLTHFCTIVVCTVSIQFVEVLNPRSFSIPRRSFYSKRGFNFWKKKEIAQFLSDYRLKKVVAPYNLKKHVVSNARIIPSTSSLRPICPFDKKASWEYTNMLSCMNEALDYHMKQSGWNSLTGIHREIRRVKKFAAFHREKFPEKRLFYIKADVTKCFANLDRGILEEVLKDLVQTRSVVVAHRFVQGPNGRWFRMMASGCDEKEARRRLNEAMKNRNCTTVATKMTALMRFNETLVDRIMSVIAGLRFRVDGQPSRLYEMQKGVPQGCMLSSRLSHLYLCAFDKYRFGWLPLGSAMFRYADDYLFMISSKEVALEVLDQLQCPRNDFGLSFRREKTQTSFNCDFSKRVGRRLVWCGFTFDTVKNTVEPRCRHVVTGLVMKKCIMARLPGHERAKHRRMQREYEQKMNNQRLVTAVQR